MEIGINMTNISINQYINKQNKKTKVYENCQFCQFKIKIITMRTFMLYIFSFLAQMHKGTSL